MIELRPKGRPGIDQTEGLVVGTRAKETAVTGRAQGATEVLKASLPGAESKGSMLQDSPGEVWGGQPWYRFLVLS